MTTTQPAQSWTDPAQRIADLEQQVTALESQLASANYQLGAAWEALPDGLEEHATLSAAISEAFGSCVGVYAATEGHTEAEPTPCPEISLDGINWHQVDAPSQGGAA